MVLQCISRKAAGFPLAPLEVHTLVHAACTLVMYAAWFRKPLDVGALIIVPTSDFKDLVALMLMQTPRFGSTSYDHLDPPKDYEELVPRGEMSSQRSEASYLMLKHLPCPQPPREYDNTATDGTSNGTVFPRNTEQNPRSESHQPGDGLDPESQIGHKRMPPIDMALTSTIADNGLVEQAQEFDLSHELITDRPNTEGTQVAAPAEKGQQVPTRNHCKPPSIHQVVCTLESGEYIPGGIGPATLANGISHLESYKNYRPRWWERPPQRPLEPLDPLEVSKELV